MAKKTDKTAADSVTKELVDFDHWHAIRKSSIPAHHHKEILQADFRSRGLSNNESMEDFDAGLEMYGVKLG
jgi:hypothetical protein